MDPINEILSKDSLNVTFLDPISGDTYGYLNLVFRLIVNPILGIAGMFLNTVNIIVFYKMGLSDGVARNFFMLALSDALFATFAFLNKLLIILRIVTIMCVGYGGLEQVINTIFQATFYCLPYLQNFSLITTCVIAVVRCCCVAMPLKVKYLLTARHQLAAILFLSGIATCVLVYAMAPMKLIYLPNLKTNSTLGFFVGARWSIYAVFNNVLSFGGFIICIACVIILSASLGKASKFRHSLTLTTEISTSVKKNKTSAPDAKSKDTQRNARVVRTVLLVCVIFIVCNVLNILFFIMLATVKGFGPVGEYPHSTELVILVSEMFLLMSVCLNTIIYVLYNSRYRSIFRTMFGYKS